MSGKIANKTRVRIVDAMCVRCGREVGWNATVCPNCGGRFLDGAIDWDVSITQVWVPVERKWYNPFSWSGGYWVDSFKK